MNRIPWAASVGGLFHFKRGIGLLACWVLACFDPQRLI
jgi:hypothetical protein